MRQRIAVLIIPVLLAAMALGQATKPAASAAAPAAKSALPSEATIDSFLKHTFSYEPNLEWKILTIQPSEVPNVAFVVVGLKGPETQQQMMKFYVMPDEKWAIVGDVVPFGADPFAPARQELAKARGPARGPANSEITIVEFSDLECPSCKAAQPTVERLLTDMPNARFIFQNFPLTDLHPWAFKAATYADCVAQQSNDAFWKFVSSTYESQEQVTAENADQKLTALAQQAGVNGDQAAKCAALPATAARVRESQALGNAVNITGTPTLFVNGRKVQNVGGIPYEILKNLVMTTK
jgi:protein-disulfide isomerase